jgi:hypothetical protein
VNSERLDVLAVPGRRERPVGEPQQVQVLGGLLPEEVIDPVDLLLVKDSMDDRLWSHIQH